MSPYPTNRETVRGARPPALRAPGEKATPEPAETPASEPETAAEVPPNPAAVGFRTEAETCGQCDYREGEFCTHPLVAQDVAAGDSCAAFEAKVAGQTEPISEGDEIA